ncbi:hypothetical protein F66182_4059 [Fusarium sp. NRRL 66182]|nr:hypothetical protein F66182_4059 [Fusarium sp. NRRL 66182]
MSETAKDLESWALSFGMAVKDLKRPEISPQAFRLEKGNSSSLLKGYTAIVVALGNTKYDVELISGDKKSSQVETWEPTYALHLRETGLKAKGGHISRWLLFHDVYHVMIRIRAGGGGAPAAAAAAFGSLRRALGETLLNLLLAVCL